MSEKKSVLALGLSHCTFLSVHEKYFFFHACNSLDDFIALSKSDMEASLKRSIRTRKWLVPQLTQQVEQDQAVMHGFAISLIHRDDPLYPDCLNEIADPPLTLFVRGCLLSSEKRSIALVGTRQPTGQAMQTAFEYGKQLAKADIAVVSGLARGIDSFAHRGAVEARGYTLAVLACGVDYFYPRSNARLAAAIIERGGAIVSEYPPRDEPLQYRFPARNRIIAGLCESTVIIEAPEKSGALITADFALDQGRNVYVVSSLLESSCNGGANRLYHQGATAIENIDTLILQQCS